MIVMKLIAVSYGVVTNNVVEYENEILKIFVNNKVSAQEQLEGVVNQLNSLFDDIASETPNFFVQSLSVIHEIPLSYEEEKKFFENTSDEELVNFRLM